MPKFMPASTLACPPSNALLNQLRNSNELVKRMVSTASSGIHDAIKSENSKEKMELATDRGSCRQRVKSPLEIIEPPKSARGNPVSGNEKVISVKKWADYSSKYGLGYFFINQIAYIFTNECIGLYFNDGTKIALDSNEQYSFY